MESILSVRHWALEEGFFQTMAPIVKHRLTHGHDLSTFAQDVEERFTAGPLRATYNDKRNRVFRSNNRIGVVPLIGTLTKNGGLCSYGMTDYQQIISNMNQDDDIDAIVLFADTPGGSVMGTPELGNTVRDSAKPIVTFVDNMLASAGVWIGSQSSHIVVNGEDPTAAVGSIGTLCMHINQSTFIEKNIGQVVIYRAEQSTDKARFNSIEPVTEEMEAELIAELTEITDLFIATVQSGRQGKLKTDGENIFTGKMYSPKDAKKYGLIDQIGSLEDAVDTAAQLAKPNSRRVAAQSKSNTSMSLASWFGRDKSAQEEPTEVVASAEEMNQLEADMQAAIQEKETLAAEVASLKAANEAAAVAAQASATRIAELEAQVADLEKQPGEEATEVGKEADASASEGEDDFASIEHSWNVKANKALGRL